MNLKSALISFAAHYLAENTSLVRKTDPTTSAIIALFGGETPEQQAARELEEDLDRAVDAVKKMKTNLKFKRITKNI